MPKRAIEFNLTPADNGRLASICGLNDEHLRQIEQGLGVDIANRGNVFRVTGEADAAASAERLLQALYHSASPTSALTPSDVQTALQQTSNDALVAPDNRVVNFVDDDQALIAEFVNVEITEALANSLRGRRPIGSGATSASAHFCG